MTDVKRDPEAAREAKKTRTLTQSSKEHQCIGSLGEVQYPFHC